MVRRELIRTWVALVDSPVRRKEGGNMVTEGLENLRTKLLFHIEGDLHYLKKAIEKDDLHWLDVTSLEALSQNVRKYYELSRPAS